MASKILAPALFAVPRIPAQLPPSRKLKLSSCPAVNSNYRVSLASGVSWGLIGPNLDAVTAAFARQPFVARAEQEVGGGEVVEGGGEAGGLAEESETVMEEGAVAVLEGEEVKVEDATKAPRNRKPRIKLGEIMGILNKRAVEASEKERPIPDIRTGDIVQIKLEVPENRRRLSIYKGIVMSRQNAGIHTTIRIRRIIAGIGVEIVFPLYSPNIKEIKVVNHRKVRRARLYYLRDKLPRFSTFK